MRVPSEADWILLRMELRQAFAAKRIPLFALLALVGILLLVQEGELPPLIILLVVTLGGMESQFTNIFFRSPHELEALSIFPLRWSRIVLIKNVAALIVTMIVWTMMAMATLYFSPKDIRLADLGNALLCASTIVFPLLHIGNIESLQAPRRNAAWKIDDLVQAAGMMLFVVILFLPYMILVPLLSLHALCIVYAILSAVHWYWRSVPTTAARVERDLHRLCATP